MILRPVMCWTEAELWITVRDIKLGDLFCVQGERRFLSDELVEGGELDQMTNGKNYREVRQFHRPNYLLRFYFITRCYNSYVATVIADLLSSPRPDVIIMNSCLWDITRFENALQFLYFQRMNEQV